MYRGWCGIGRPNLLIRAGCCNEAKADSRVAVQTTHSEMERPKIMLAKQ
jgi:hypothetical protein